MLENRFRSSHEKGKEKRKHILIVEDDRISVLYFKELLDTIEFGDTNIYVHYVSTGEEALEFCERNPVDLILMDLKLSGIGGLETTRIIKNIDPGIIIIAQTAYALSTTQSKALEAGCDDYISKPISIDDLQLKLHTHLRI